MNTNKDAFIEPTAPSVPAFSPSRRDVPSPDFVGRARPTEDQGFKQREQDLVDYKADLEHRIQRSEQLAAKRHESLKKEVNVVAELDAALEDLELGADDFDQSYGKPNRPLIDAKIEAERLRSELIAAESRLAEIEARGDSVTRLQRTDTHAEGALNGLLSATEEQ